MLSAEFRLHHLQPAKAQQILASGRISAVHRRYKYHRRKGSLPGVAAPDAAESGVRGQELIWGQRFAEKQRKQVIEVAKLSDRLQLKILDLDVEANAYGSRILSNATASSSSNVFGQGARKYRGSHRQAQLLAPPSPEVLVALLRQANAKRALLQELDVQSPRAVASRLLLLSSQLGIPAEQLVAMARDCGRLLSKRPDELQAGLAALADCMEAIIRSSGTAAGSAGSSRSSGSGSERRGGGGGSNDAAGGQRHAYQREERARAVRAEAEARAREMVASAPRLLLMAPERLRRSGLELGAVCKARGIQLLPMLSLRPDLLQQSASSLAAKMDVLPAALGLPPRRMREVLAACPDLLRRSPHELTRRYRLLQGLFRVPAAFMAELVLQEPRVLCFGADTLRVKFEGLAGQYGRFQDDVTDMILVDPSVLIKASAGTAPSATSSPSSSPRSSSSGSSISGSTEGGDRTDGDGGGPAATAAAPRDLPVLDRILQLSSASGVPVDTVLQLVVQDARICGYSRQQVTEHLAALASALGLGPKGADSVRARVAEHPGLLLLDLDQLRTRSEAVARLLQLLPPGDVDAAAGGGGGTAAAAAAPSPGAAALLQRHPELLLQDSAELQGRVAALSTLLLGGTAAAAAAAAPVSATAAAPAAAADAVAAVPPRVLALIATQPGLLAAPPTDAADKLRVMQSLFEIPRALVLELIFKEPALLAVSLGDLEAKFRALASSFGAFSSDAIDVVLADPSLILRADADERDAAAQNPRRRSGTRRGAGGDLDLGRSEDNEAEGDDVPDPARSRSVAGGGAAGRRPGSKSVSRSCSPVADTAASSGRRGRARVQVGVQTPAQTQAQAEQRGQSGQGQEQQERRQRGREAQSEGPPGGDRRRGRAVAEADGWGRSGGSQTAGAAATPYGPVSVAASERRGRSAAGGGSGLGREEGGAGGRGSAGSGRGSAMGGGGGKGDMGLLGMMSAADFDKLGSEGLPPPPPSSRRRRRQQEQQP